MTYGFNVTRFLDYEVNGVYKTRHDLVYVSDRITVDHLLLRILVPRNLLTDLASIPPLLHWICPPWWPARAAVVHDWLYRLLCVDYMKNGASKKWHVQRKMADYVFYDAMRYSEHKDGRRFPDWMRSMFYRTVRMFGRKACMNDPLNALQWIHDISIPSIDDILPVTESKPAWQVKRV